ncbi:MAG TPA: biotin--[acetyl-CoA-carboxylase] ligase [Ruminococcaceae bacterium]|nr:biotin--[acetyl-CoA-carboxylase] ligase [Oscillospiraceae bacterium]
MNNLTIPEILIQTNEYVSGQTLAEKLGVSRQAVWKEINALRDEGYEISSVPRKGYKLEAAPKHLNEAALKSNLKTNIIGKNPIVLETVGSTNDYLKALGAQGCENGTVVAAREQVAGKGRLGRVWKSKRDDSVMFSLLLRPKIAPGEVSAITPLAGLAVCKALRDFAGIDCKIKWPNDIISGNKKLAGILTEMSAEFDAVEYIVTGIGINADQAVFPEEIAYKATSLLLETGRHFDKNKLLARVLKQIEDEFLNNDLELSHTALGEYTSLCATIGRNVTFMRGTRRVSGMAVSLNRHGELNIMLSDGTICTVNSGEVTVQGIY